MEKIAELDDKITISDELENFMRNPTKAFAMMLYEWSIEKWFEEHGIEPETEKIALRHNIQS